MQNPAEEVHVKPDDILSPVNKPLADAQLSTPQSNLLASPLKRAKDIE